MRRCFWSILFLTALTSAQAPSGVPECAKTPVEQAIKSSGCAASDKKCICNSEQVTSAVETATEACSEADQDALFSAIGSLCEDGTQVVEEPAVQPAAPTPVSEGPTSQEQPQLSNETPSPSPLPSIASEETNQATLSTPTLIATPPQQPSNETPSPPSIASEETKQATLSTPILIATPPPPPTDLPSTTAPVPTAATSLNTDTREFSPPDLKTLDNEDEEGLLNPQQDGTNPDPNGLTSATTTLLPTAEDQDQLSTNATSSDQNPHSASPHSASPGSISHGSGGPLSTRPGGMGLDVTGVAGREVVVGFGGLVFATVLCWVLA